MDSRDQEFFLPLIAAIIKVFFFQKKLSVGSKIFVLIMGYCVLNLGSLLREVPPYHFSGSAMLCSLLCSCKPASAYNAV